MAFDPSALGGSRILIASDEWFYATYISEAVASAGGIALGPVPTAGATLELITSERPDAVTLNAKLGDECSFPVADKLLELRIPFLFTTATVVTLPVRLLHIPLLTKPFAAYQVVAALDRSLKQRLTSGPIVRGH